jgi:autotransporter translocation and assembly factor TamB
VARDGFAVADAEIALPSSRDAPLGGLVRLNRIQLGSLAPFLPDLERIEGEVTGSLQLSGTVDQPRADGTIRLAGGSIALVGNPTEVKDLALVVDVAGNRADLQGRALFGGGELQLSGQFLSVPRARLSLQVTGGKHTIFYPPSTELQVSENLALDITADLFDIQGEVVVHEGRLEHEELPEGSVDVSSDVVEVDYAGNVITEQNTFATSMDVLLRIRERFKVVGSNIDATVGGDLQLLQTAGRPIQVFGNLNVVGGEVRAYEQHLKIKRGVVAFSGTPDNPELDVRAQRDFTRENISVGVAVGGTLEQPTIEFYSDPVMSQAETLSWLVRGRGLDVGAGADGTAMALSLGAGLVNRSAIVSELNQIPGVSGIQFGAEGSEDDTAATVSGYIGEKLYLSYGIGLYEPINVITARFYLKTRLWLEVVSRLENSVDLYYSWDID